MTFQYKVEKAEIKDMTWVVDGKKVTATSEKMCIRDSSWRSFMLDEGRYFKGEKVVKQILDEMALLKMNVFQWHLTDDQGWRIEIKKYPRLTEIGAFRDSTQMEWYESHHYDGKPHGGFYTQTQIQMCIRDSAKAVPIAEEKS